MDTNQLHADQVAHRESGLIGNSLRRASIGAILLSALLCAVLAIAEDPAATRRKSISDKGKVLFRKTTNHCYAFRDLVAYAITQSKSTSEVIEDLKFVLIGNSLRQRRTGEYYIGKEPGAGGDTGFQDALRDKSPQTEHAMAAIYVGKNYPPGSAETVALLTEIAEPLINGRDVGSADILLWSLGGDIGQRVSDKELSKLPSVIEKTMCK